MNTETTPRKMTIDIWSDVMCPWCLIGYGQLQKGLALLDGEIEANVRWHPFELNPDMPATGQDQAEHLAQKYRRPPEEAQAVRTQMKRIAADAGVSLEYAGPGEGGGDAPPAMMWNTFDAHKLLTWALDNAGAEKQTELKLALFAAHFNERRNLSDHDVLVDVARSVGLDADGARAALSDEQLGDRVRAEEHQAYDMNVTGVPAMVVEGKFMIPGAQEPETYANALRRVASRTG